jgi:hypothetical protein
VVDSRRKFLKVGTLAGLAVVIPSKSLARTLGQKASADQADLHKVPVENQADQLNSFNEETFSQHLNTEFRIYTSPLTAITMELIQVKRWEASADKKAATATRSAKIIEVDCFSAIFRGPRRVVLVSGTYRVTHAQMGTFDLFISPVNDRKKEWLYQAVFNRLRS